MNVSFSLTNFSLCILLFALVGVGCSPGASTMAQANAAASTTATTGTRVTTTVTEPFAYLGQSVALSGEMLAAGAPGENARQGAVYLWQKEPDGWHEQTRLVAADGRADDEFGFAVAIDGDLLVVGAAYRQQAAGTIYIFERQAAGWVEQARLTREAGQNFDLFGYDVAISGDTVVVGARSVNDPQHGRNTGAVYVYQRQQNEWQQQARLVSPAPAPTAHFGHAVAVDGDQIVVGAFGEDDAQNGRKAGSAYIFQRQGQEWHLQTRLTAADGDRYDAFGYAVAIDGDTVAVSASQHHWGHEQFLGAVYLFEQQGGNWAEQTKLTPTNSETLGGIVGHSLALAGDALLVGGYGLRGIHHFEREQGTWVERPMLATSNPPDSLSLSLSNHALAVDGRTAVIGDRGGPAGQSNNLSGALLLYELGSTAAGETTGPPTPTTPVESAAPEPIPLPATAVQPLFNGQHLRVYGTVHSRSANRHVPPDGQFVAVSHLEPPTDPRSDRQESSLHFWHIQDGTFCATPQTLSAFLDPATQMAWLANDRVLMVPGDGTISAGEPCGESDFAALDHLFNEPIRAIAARSPNLDRLLLRGDQSYWLYQPDSSAVQPVAGLTALERNFHSWSPDGQRVSIAVAAGSEQTIYLIDAASGQTLQRLPTAGSLPHYWHLNRYLMLHQRESEPLLVDLDQPMSRPAPMLSQYFGQYFGQDVSYPADTMAFGVYPTGSGDGYTVFVAVREPTAEGIYLYDADSDAVEIFPYDRPTHLLFADGLAVFVDKFDWERPDGGANGRDNHQFYWMGTPDGQLSQIDIVGHQPRTSALQPLWLPETSRMVFASSQGVSLVSLPDGQLLNFWRLEGTEHPVQTALVSLSPNGQTLVVEAITQPADMGPGDTYLYAIPLP
jgi:hypothetical protein